MKYKVRLQGDDGKDYVITYDDLKENLGIVHLDKREENRFNVIWERLRELNEELERIYVPQFEKRFLDFVKANPNWRLCQLVFNVANNTETMHSKDVFYVEDGVFEISLNKYIERE